MILEGDLSDLFKKIDSACLAQTDFGFSFTILKLFEGKTDNECQTEKFNGDFFESKPDNYSLRNGLISKMGIKSIIK